MPHLFDILKGQVVSEKEAKGLILAGKVLVNDQVQTSPAFMVKEGDDVRIRGQKMWVARSADKLLAAVEKFNFPVAGRRFFDLGASTGGFTEVLLKEGAERVLCVDVSYGFLHPSLRNDSRVTALERTNLFHLHKIELPFVPGAFVMDVSFVRSEEAILYLKENFHPLEGIILFKPQFSAEPTQLQKGIVVKPEDREILAEQFKNSVRERGVEILGELDSPLPGSKGNIERLFWLRWN